MKLINTHGQLEDMPYQQQMEILSKLNIMLYANLDKWRSVEALTLLLHSNSCEVNHAGINIKALSCVLQNGFKIVGLNRQKQELIHIEYHSDDMILTGIIHCDHQHWVKFTFDGNTVKFDCDDNPSEIAWGDKYYKPDDETFKRENIKTIRLSHLEMMWKIISNKCESVVANE